MNISVPVTDYIPASVLTTLNDIVVRGAAIPARQPGLLRAIGTHLFELTRSTGGAQGYTGVGFHPSLLIIFIVDILPTNLDWSLGFGDETGTYCMYQYDNGTNMNTSPTQIVSLRRSVGNTLFGVLTSLDADGFTLTWTLTGAASLKGFYIALP